MKECAVRLGIGMESVAQHAHAIYKRLGMTRHEFITWWMSEHGIPGSSMVTAEGEVRMGAFE
jgi:DNA-binding CsgD family transcriptional regulator